MSSFARFLIRYCGVVSAVTILLGAIGTYYSVRLFSNLRTELEELLPTQARSVLDLDEVRRRMESTNNLCILIFSDRPNDSKRFVVDLAERFKTIPKSISEGVEYRIDKELQFFEDRKALFIESADIARIKRYIQEKINFETQLYNPLTIIENRTLKEPLLDLKALRKKYNNKTDNYTRFKDGFYATDDQKIRVILVHLPGSAGGISGSNALRKAVDEKIAELSLENYDPNLKVHFTGGVQDLIEEHEALVEDLLLSTILVSLVVGAAMIIYFRSVLATSLLILSLLIGAFVTFGVSFFVVGYLNANSAFMGSIVIGNGVNFGIILLARFIEERRRRRGVLASIARSVDLTLPATVIASAAAGFAYGSLILTSFRGFRQFGIIGLIGMVICWIFAYTALPAFLALAYRFGKLRTPIAVAKGGVARSLSHLVSRFPKPILLISSILSVLSLASFAKFSPEIIETDLKKLRNKNSMKSGSMYWGKYQDDVFQRYLTPIVILPKTRSEVLAIADEIRNLKDAEAKTTFISNVSTIEDFVPQDQLKKIADLKEIDQLLTPKIRYQLPESERKVVEDLLRRPALNPFTEAELPELVRSKFRERDGTIGNLVLVEPSLDPNLSRSDNLIHFVGSIRAAADRILPGVAVAGTLPVTSDMFKSIVADGPKATLFAFLTVLGLVIVLFRKTSAIVQCSFALILGVLWLAGYILGFDQKINFLNFIALPITFGIGVDYGVNIFQRYRLDPAGGILKTIEETGGAVLLASFTTVVGYGSLVIASNQAFVSFGVLAVIGEVTCVLAAVVSLPALLLMIERGKNRESTEKNRLDA